VVILSPPSWPSHSHLTIITTTRFFPLTILAYCRVLVNYGHSSRFFALSSVSETSQSVLSAPPGSRLQSQSLASSGFYCISIRWWTLVRDKTRQDKNPRQPCLVFQSKPGGIFFWSPHSSFHHHQPFSFSLTELLSKTQAKLSGDWDLLQSKDSSFTPHA
jgi:hypothetical protein